MFVQLRSKYAQLRMRTIELYNVSVDATPSSCSFNSLLQLALAQLFNDDIPNCSSSQLFNFMFAKDYKYNDLLGEVVVFF
jgi:hypothetical protein